MANVKTQFTSQESVTVKDEIFRRVPHTTIRGTTGFTWHSNRRAVSTQKLAALVRKEAAGA